MEVTPAETMLWSGQEDWPRSRMADSPRQKMRAKAQRGTLLRKAMTAFSTERKWLERRRASK
jgi:hypothetical protein